MRDSTSSIPDTSATLVDGPPSLVATRGAPGASAFTARGMRGDETQRSTQNGTRTTVLPRFEVVDGRPVVVATARHRYEALSLLGEGGVGRVDKAQDNDIGRAVAVKRLHPDLSTPSNLARFVDEIRLIGQLEHPNIVPIHDVGVDERGEFFFVMKYVEGETLEKIIERLAAGDPAYHDRYPIERRVEIFIGILDAVHYAHARRIVHRDLKPANIMVGRFGEVMVMDWGIARRAGEADPVAPAGEGQTTAAADRVVTTQAGALMGTPLYMSPEQARGEPVDERSDIYSLCVLLYEFLSLTHPLAGRTTLVAVLEGVMNYEPTAASFLRHPHQPSVGMDLSWFLRAGLAKDPARRFPSVAAMRQRLQARAEGDIPIQCHITFLKRAMNEMTHVVDRHPIVVTTGLAFLTLGVVGGLILRASLNAERIPDGE